MKIGIIRCRKNEEQCPLTSCLMCLQNGREGFSVHREPCQLMGVMTCTCPGEDIGNLAQILEKKEAQAIHLCTCVFAGKSEAGWTEGDGFCDDPTALLRRVSDAVSVPCFMGTAHLPKGYAPKRFGCISVRQTAAQTIP